MKSIYLFFVGLFLVSSACTTLQNSTTKTLFTLDQDQVTVDEFKYVYQKNNFNRPEGISTREDINNYLELFINFKLKVKEAELQGLHQTEEFKNELEGYRKQLAKPYLTETSVTEQLALEAYKRLREEINAAHILIGIPGEGSPEDTLSAYQQAVEIREQALNGTEFSGLASKYSKDPSAVSNGGNLGYFSAFQMVYPFEEAAYNTKVGSISDPIRTQFGYHLVKVLDRRPALGKVKVSHIMIRAAEGITDQDSLSASKQAHEIYQRLQNDGDWEKLCQQFSDDLTTRSKSGALPWLGAGDMNNIPTFAKTAFELQKIGDISSPVQTPYGWHIIRLDDKKGLESYEAMAEELKQKIGRDSRSALNQQALINRLKDENQFVEVPENKVLALESGSDSLFLGYPHYDSLATDLNLPIFNIKSQTFTVREFYEFISKNNKPGKFQNTVKAKEQLYQEFANTSLIQYEENHLAEKYDDYRLLYQEYRDGILLFQLMDEIVWNKALKDTTGLKGFFETHHDQYFWGPRAKATIYSTSRALVIDQVKDFLANGHYVIEKFDFARALGTNDQSFSDIEYGIIDRIIVKLKQNPSMVLNVSYDNSQPGYNQLKDSLILYLQDNKIPESRAMVENGSGVAHAFLLYLRCLTAECLEIALNEKDALNLKVDEGLYEQGDRPLVDRASWENGISELNDQDQFHLIDISETIPKMPKELNEIRGQVISDYQTQLEQDWVKELRKKYTVKVNKNVLEKTIKHLEN